jgi:hypothetical protein
MYIYKTIILHLVLYRCETSYSAVSEEHRLRVSEIRVLRRIFEPRRDDVTGDWGKLLKEESRSLFSSQGIIRMLDSRKMCQAGYVACLREKKIAYWNLVVKPGRKSPLRRPRHGWLYDIKMDIKRDRIVIWTELMWLRTGTSEGLF